MPRMDERLRAEVDCAVPLTEVAWRFRYPGEPEGLDVGEALAIASALFEAVVSLLPQESRP